MLPYPQYNKKHKNKTRNQRETMTTNTKRNEIIAKNAKRGETMTTNTKP